MKELRELPSEHYDTREKRRKALINSGLVGIVRAVTPLADTGVWLLAGSFEYQVKDTLQPNTEDIFVAHPILYEHMRMSVCSKALVYPYPYEEDERAELEKMGVSLV